MEDSKDWENIARQLKENPASQEDRIAFQKWLQESPENERLFKDGKQIWDMAGSVEEEYTPDTNLAWKKFKAKTNLGAHQFEENERVEGFSLTFFLRVAATLVLIAGVGYYLYFNYKKEDLVVVQTTAKQTKEVHLPDGSKVWLNRNSKLSYPNDFDIDDRIVYLSGEAFFEVKKEDGEKFTIFSNNAKTEVLGTEFNVRAYEDESEVQVTVVTGRVAFSLNNDATIITLQPGDKGLLTTDNFLSKTLSENKNEIAWKTKKLIFENTHLNIVLNRLEEYFGTAIIAKNKDILNCRFTGNFEDVELSQVLEVLSVSVDLKYAKKENSYYLTGVGCK